MPLIADVVTLAFPLLGSSEAREWSLFGIQTLSLLFLAVYVVLTGKMSNANQLSARAAVDSLNELKRVRAEELAPYVIAYFQVPQDIGTVIHFVVENTGRSPAENVRFESTPVLQTSDPALKSRRPIYKHGVRLLPPGQKLSTTFDQTVSYFKDETRPLSYKMKIKYRGPNGTYHERLQVLDLGFLRGMGHIVRRGTHELVEESKKMVRLQEQAVPHLERIAKELASGIRLTNPYLAVANVSSHPADDAGLPRLVASSLVAWWEMVCSTETAEHLPAFEAHDTCKALAQQVLAAIATCELTRDGAVRETLLEIYGTLLMMASTRFYMDGGNSLRRFHMRGDRVRRMSQCILSGGAQIDPSQMTLPFRDN
ncbi:hypothetical protein [Alienimonas chondri]|uniref:Uncharacterized protein n=1 Tax=Alienimonas chondri TaxID=2681879 RepID=A0ABX1VD30_9PLAN|nr:hypothetical protein [Alienimonas chondri]NNJ26019.1 hypothetical protein [Alienimonas chondri]